MIMSLFRRRTNLNRRIVDSAYTSIVTAARNPVFYADWGVPDTPLGRYESVGLHMILFLYRTRGLEGAAEGLSQDVLDEFFKDVDHSIRELGVGDPSVPKRMKKLARMFYGRMGNYWKALDQGDPEALGEAIARNIAPETPDAVDRVSMAGYMMHAADGLKQLPDAELLTGVIRFPEPAAHAEG